jgi:predicted dithiol-disulfide oxidoreductase (DUF899 family)
MATAPVANAAPRVVSHSEWLTARKEFLAKEKQLTRLRDELASQRRQLPWEKLEKNYVFDSPSGKVTLADLFGDKSQLIVYHFMFSPDWEEGCRGCSFVSDHVAGSLPHLAARDVAYAAISRAPLAKLDAFRKRMGWNFTWVSSNTTDFNYDYNVSFTREQVDAGTTGYNFGTQRFPEIEGPGASCFIKDEAGNIFHTYSSFGRGLDGMINAYNWLDIAPKGRDESSMMPPMAWVRHHDKYPQSNPAAAATKDTGCCHHENQ